MMKEDCEERKKNMRNIKEILMSNGYIVVNKNLINVIGINAALLYSELVSMKNFFTKKHQLDVNSYFYIKPAELEKTTGLSKYQQNQAIKILEAIGLIESTVVNNKQKKIKIIEDDEVLSELKDIVSIKKFDTASIKKLDTWYQKISHLVSKNLILSIKKFDTEYQKIRYSNADEVNSDAGFQPRNNKYNNKYNNKHNNKQNNKQFVSVCHDFLNSKEENISPLEKEKQQQTDRQLLFNLVNDLFSGCEKIINQQIDKLDTTNYSYSDYVATFQASDSIDYFMSQDTTDNHKVNMIFSHIRKHVDTLKAQNVPIDNPEAQNVLIDNKNKRSTAVIVAPGIKVVLNWAANYSYSTVGSFSSVIKNWTKDEIEKCLSNLSFLENDLPNGYDDNQLFNLENFKTALELRYSEIVEKSINHTIEDEIDFVEEEIDFKEEEIANEQISSLVNEEVVEDANDNSFLEPDYDISVLEDYLSPSGPDGKNDYRKKYTKQIEQIKNKKLSLQDFFSEYCKEKNYEDYVDFRSMPF